MNSRCPIFAPVIRTTAFLVFIAHAALAQQYDDSLATKQLEDVIVTATRNERTMGALPMPVSLVSKGQIKTMGSLRLTDVLSEQTGLVVVPQVNAQGNGIQVQGFNPDYTLILIDGEPIIGRYTGSLELSRIAVGNIKQIEIVKGPSSSLYGSDALAGVINIITERPTGTRGNISSRYGTNNTLDLTGDINLTKDKFGIYVFANRYSTDGYDLSPQNFGKTVSPFANYTVNSKLTYKLSPKTDLSISGRHFDERQHFNFEVTTPTNQQVRTSGTGTSEDWNINPVLVHRFSNQFKVTGRFYATRYKTATLLNLESDGSPYYNDDFNQSFTRPELNAEYYFNEKNILTLGAGHIQESVQTSRYGDEVKRRQETSYGFFQHEWMPIEKLSVIGGLRYDNNSNYGSQLSPKLSSKFDINKKISLKISGGFGFKAPDFRQLYYNFTNLAGGGYSVLGTEVVGQKLVDLEAQGQIKKGTYEPSLINKLEAERSVAINIGIQAKLIGRLAVDANVFHNSINNMIASQIVVISNFGPIYSFRNIARTFTQGLETNVSYPLLFKCLTVSAGHQLLFAKDKDILRKIKNDDLFYRDPVTLITKRLKRNEYFGLDGRSRHIANFKIFYQSKTKELEVSLRVIYRGKYGIGDIRGNIQGETIPSPDRNNNSILDKYDDFVKGYALVNISVAKSIKQGLRFQLGIDNLFDHTEPIFIPNLPGRLMYGSVSYSFSKNKSINQ